MTTTNDRKTPLPLIGAAVGSGAPDEGCADGPQALRDGGLVARLATTGLIADWHEILSAPRRSEGADPLATIAMLDKKLAAITERLVRDDQPFVAFGGDHSAAIGLWSGVARAVRPGRFGLIWIDAHMDSHTFATTPSRMIHGMPVASLLGHGEPMLTSLAGSGAAVAPENLCLIGTRSWEEGEAALLERLGARVIKMPEVDSRGFAAAFADAIAIASDGTARFGISIDIDAFDPMEIMGTGLHVPDGLYKDDVVHALRELQRQPTLAGIEIAEYNPHHDHNGATAKLIGDMVAAAFGPA
jgi:arginase